jgi:hypothetical protein
MAGKKKLTYDYDARRAALEEPIRSEPESAPSALRRRQPGFLTGEPETVYRNPAGREVVVIYTQLGGGPLAPLTGDHHPRGSVRTGYLTDSGVEPADDAWVFGWEDPCNLRPLRTLGADVMIEPERAASHTQTVAERLEGQA